MSNTVDGTLWGNDVWWTNSATALAAERNLKVPWLTIGTNGQLHGAFHDEQWYATAAGCITACVSGMEAMWFVGGDNGLTPRWGGEVARAAAGIKVSEGNAMIKEIGKRMKESKQPKPAPTPLSELYDLKTLTPTEKYLNQYKKFTKMFKDMGLDYPTWD
jgi:methylamine--corrinoid protein Co-methyltransferase